MLQTIENMKRNGLTWTAINLNPHGYVSVPTHRSNSYVACSDWFAYFVINDGLSVTISTKDLCKLSRQVEN